MVKTWKALFYLDYIKLAKFQNLRKSIWNQISSIFYNITSILIKSPENELPCQKSTPNYFGHLK